MAFKDYLEQEIINLTNKEEGNSFFTDALEQFRQMGFPTLKDEHWKYTPLNFLFRNEFHLLKESISSELNIDEILASYYIPNNSNIIIIKDGYFLSPHLIDDENIQFAILGNTHITPSTDPKINSINNNIFGLLNGTFQNELITMNIKNETKPVVILNLSTGSNSFVNPNITINLHPNSKSEIYWYNLTLGEGNLSNASLNINLSENSRLTFHDIQNNPLIFYTVNNIQISQEANSDLNYHSFLFQTKFSRNNFKIELNGSGIESKLFGLFIGKNDSIVDNHILMSHNMPHCHSNQFFKGIIEDTSRGVFNGKVLVKKDAQKTDAYQSNKNILTTKEASIFTKPELEIYADDVKCSHGATSGFLQEDELFYLMSRGIGQKESKSLLLKAFANEVIDKVENEDFREWLHSKLDEVI